MERAKTIPFAVNVSMPLRDLLELFGVLRLELLQIL
jgi:hypothetical protein